MIPAYRDYTADELEAVRLTELAQDRRTPEEKAAATWTEPRDGQVKLYHPTFDGLRFGSGSGPETTDEQIVFGTFEPGVAVVRADHPLLPRLLKRHPSVVVLMPGEKPGRTYACDACDGEFKSKALLGAHRKEAHSRRTKAAATTDDGA